MAQNLTDRRAELVTEIARLEQTAAEAENAAVMAMAGGKPTDAATSEMDKAQSRLRIARAALVALDRALQAEDDAQKAARARALQADADRLDAEAERVLLALYEHLGVALADAEQFMGLRPQLQSLVYNGAKTKHVHSVAPLAALRGAYDALRRQLAVALTEEALRPLGLSKPPTPRELAIASTEASLKSATARLADFKQRQATAADKGVSPRSWEPCIREAERAQQYFEEHLANLRGEPLPVGKLSARRRQAQLDALNMGR